MDERRKNDKRARLPKLKISPVLYVMIAAFCAFGYYEEVLSYLAAVVLHELSHAALSKKLGYVLTEFRLMPYGAALIGEYENASARDEIAIAAIGPACNFFLLLITVAAWWLCPAFYDFTACFAAANLCLVVVNLLPVFPLDGGRILLAALSRYRSRSVALKKMKIVSFAFGAAFAALFLISFAFGVNFSFATMSAFIVSSAAVPAGKGGYESVYRVAYRTEKIERGLRVRRIMVSSGTAAARLRRLLSPDRYTVFSVVSPALGTLGEITESDVDSAYPDETAAELLEKSRASGKKPRSF